MNKIPIIKVRRVDLEAVLPKYEHKDDSGADVFSIEDAVLEPMQRQIISTGLAVEIPPGFEIQIRTKSGLALKHGIAVLNSPGTIDAGYRGEVKVILINFGTQSFHVNKGDKIAQMVVAKVDKGNFVETDQLSQSDRGIGGFGSTDSHKGRKT